MAFTIPGDASDLLRVLDLGGIAVFAATGALAAARRKHDIVTFGFFACMTGVGGGTLRDLLLEVPVFWLRDPSYLAVCLVVAGLIWLSGAGAGWRLKALLWLDAVGMAAYAIVGATKASAAGVPSLTVIVMGVLTASFGGIIRDVFAGEPSVLLRREIYVLAAAIGAGAFVILDGLGFTPDLAAAVGFLAAFAVRGGALAFGWTLPGFRREVVPSDDPTA